MLMHIDIHMGQLLTDMQVHVTTTVTVSFIHVHNIVCMQYHMLYLCIDQAAH